MNSWKIFVPATTANLGSGFDCLGLALSLYDQFTFFPVEGSVKSAPLYGSKEKSPYAPKGNLVIDSYWAYGKREGVKLPAMKVKIGGDIPSTRGLGSSAACSVAGVLAAALYSGAFGSFQDLEKKLDPSGFYYPMQEKGEALDAIVEAAVFMEGHPDNAIPALFGGLNQSSCQGKRTLYSHLPLSQDLRFLLLIPDFMVSTEEARAILPKEIDRVKACQNIGYLAFLLEGLRTGDRGFLSLGLQDHLHEPFRKKLIPGFDEIKKRAVEAGAAGCVISGAGSSLLVILDGNSPLTGDYLKAFGPLPRGWKALDLRVDEKGPKITRGEE